MHEILNNTVYKNNISKRVAIPYFELLSPFATFFSGPLPFHLHELFHEICVVFLR